MPGHTTFRFPPKADRTDGDTSIEILPREVTVLIPDLFSSFLSVPARVNPLYEEVKLKSEAWLSE